MEYILLTGLVAAMTLLVYARRHNKSKREISSVIEESRKRAQERYDARAFADTVPNFDPYRTGIQFQHAISAVEVNDSFDNAVELTQEQLEAIAKIFEEHEGGQDITVSAEGLDMIEINVNDYKFDPVVDPWKNAS